MTENELSKIIVDSFYKIHVELGTGLFENIHKKQLLTYLKLTDIKLGLLVNFNVDLIKNGVVRIVNKL